MNRIPTRPGRALCWTGLLLAALVLGRQAAAQNYLEYYRAVAGAEAAAVAHGYHDAIRRYEAAFGAYPYTNPVDCYIAAQLAAHVGDSGQCRSFLCRGFCFGLPVQTVRGNPRLAPYLQAGAFALPQALVDSCWRVYQARIDPAARATLLGLIRRDQGVIRNLPPGESLHDRNGDTLKAAYRPLWDSLFGEVLRLTRTSGFPAQKTTGTQTGEDGVFAISPHSLYAYYILIHHGAAWPQLRPVLWGELERGNITPQVYGALADHSDRSQPGPLPYMALRDCAAFLSRRACRRALRGHLQQLDSARESIGLCSYAVMQGKRESTQAYLAWCRRPDRKPEPVFDFQSELHFRTRQEP